MSSVIVAGSSNPTPSIAWYDFYKEEYGAIAKRQRSIRSANNEEGCCTDGKLRDAGKNAVARWNVTPSRTKEQDNEKRGREKL